MEFSIHDIQDLDLLARLIRKEAEEIWENPANRRDRTIEELETAVKKGKIAELYLVQSGHYKWNNKKYHDLIKVTQNKEEEVEVKAYDVTTWDCPRVMEDVKRYRTSNIWPLVKWLMIFQVTGDYRYSLLAILRIRS